MVEAVRGGSAAPANDPNAADQNSFHIIHDFFRERFLKYFKMMIPKKFLIIEESLYSVIYYLLHPLPDDLGVVKHETLTDQFQLHMPQIGRDESCVQIYIVRPELESVQMIIDQLMMQHPDDIKNAHILFVPRRTIECDELLVEQKRQIEERIGVPWNIDERIQHFALDFLMLEDDLMSLELPDDFRHFLLADDDTYQVYVQNSINRLETIYGKIKYKYAKGNIAKLIIQRLKKQSQGRQLIQDTAAGGSGDAEIDCLVLLDRSIDLISPFCVQQNYEGQLDETFGIHSGVTKISNRIINPSQSAAGEINPDEQVAMRLTNETDFIFKEVRNKSLSALGSVTTRKLEEIQALINKKEAKMSIKEMTKYMQDIKNMNIAQSKQLIDSHVNVAMEIKDRQKNIDYQQCFRMEHTIISGCNVREILTSLEAKMTRKYNMYTVLRLMTLLSTTNSGLKQAEFDQLRRAFIMCYGYQEIATILNLQDSRLLKVRDKKFDWNKIKSELSLVNEEVRIDNPQSIHYVFGGMAPISVSLLQRMFEGRGFAAIQRVLNLLPGEVETPGREEAELYDTSGGSLRVKKVLVYFLGGVTYAEVAAIRFLNTTHLGARYKFVVATTSIISSEKCMRQMRTAATNNLDLNTLA